MGTKGIDLSQNVRVRKIRDGNIAGTPLDLVSLCSDFLQKQSHSLERLVTYRCNPLSNWTGCESTCGFGEFEPCTKRQQKFKVEIR